MLDLCTTMCEVTQMNHTLVRVGAGIWALIVLFLTGVMMVASVSGGF